MKRTVVLLTAAAMAGGGLVTHQVLERERTPAITYAQDRPAFVSFAGVVKSAVPAVVNITSTRVIRTRGRGGQQLPPGFEDFFGPFFGPRGRGGEPPQERRGGGTGSGVIVSRDGYILTNNHVVEDAETVTVTLTDRRELTAKVIGTDPLTDLAVVKVDGTNLPVLQFADSAKAQVGDIVLAIGSPLGLRSTVTMGIISAIGRNVGIVGEGQGYEDFIQTDAPINPGNSGGALINVAGELLGINTAILSGSGGNQGIGFAIPSELARDVMDQLVKKGKVTRSYIGVGIQEVTPSLSEAFKAPIGSVVITQVEPDAPGSKAGLEVGDIILGLNGETVTDSNQFRLRISRMAPGTAVKLKINRNGQTREIPVTLAARPGSEGEERQSSAAPGTAREALEGVEVEALTAQVRQQLGLGPGIRGVVVSDVDSRSPAAEAGLQRGDVIQSVNRQPVTSVAEFNKVLGTATGKTIVLLVNRGGNSIFVAVETDGRR